MQYILLLNAGVSLLLHDSKTLHFLNRNVCIIQSWWNCNICEMHAHAEML